jgi:hypothetical protein
VNGLCAHKNWRGKISAYSGTRVRQQVINNITKLQRVVGRRGQTTASFFVEETGNTDRSRKKQHLLWTALSA